MSEVKILDKTFKVSLSETEIQKRIKEMANKINSDLANDDVIFLGI